MSDLEIKTDRRPRMTIDWDQLTPAERTNFDYLDTDERRWGAEFVRYRGWVYETSDFVAANAEVFPGWDGSRGDSYSSGVLMRICDDGCVIMGRYCC